MPANRQEFLVKLAQAKRNDFSFLEGGFDAANINLADETGDTFLACAVRHNDVDAVQALLEKGACLVINKDGQHPLHLAALYGNVEILTALCEKFPYEARLPDAKRNTLAHLAARSDGDGAGAAACLNYLVNTLSFDFGSVNADKETPASIIVARTQTDGERPVVKALEEFRVDQPLSSKVFHRSVLQETAKEIVGNIKQGDFSPILADKRLLKPHSINVIVYPDGTSWLLLCAQNTTRANPVAAVKKLLEHGAAVDQRDMKEGKTALFRVCEQGGEHAVAIAELLLKAGADPDARDVLGRTPFMMATAHGNIQMLKLLIDHQCKPQEIDSEGNTALHYAAEQTSPDRVQLLRYLLEEARVDKTIANNKGETALDIAAKKNPGFARLLKNGDIWWRIQARDETLLEPGQIPAYFDPNAQDHEGNSALHMAVRFLPALIPTLLQLNANPLVRNRADKTPVQLALEHAPEQRELLQKAVNDRLLKAAENNDHDGVRAALEAGADVNAPEQRAPLKKAANDWLLKAAENNDHDGVRAALEAGADVNVTDELGNTALHLIAKVCKPGDQKTLEILLARNPDILLLNAAGQLALSIVAERKLPEELFSVKNQLQELVQKKLWEAIEADNQDLLQRAIAAGADITKPNRVNGQTPLEAASPGFTECVQGHLDRLFLEAAARCDVAELRHLVTAGARKEAWRGPDQDTALHLIARHAGPDDLDALNYLLAEGLDPAARNAERPRGHTAAYFAKQRQAGSKLAMRLEAAKKAGPNLLKAIAENNAAAAETALEDGAKYRLTAFPENPLHVVARGISLELVKALVRHCDASLKDEKGYTLLDIAVRHAQCPAIVDYLACRCEDAQALESALRLVPDPAAGVGAGGAVVDETAEITEIKKKLHTVLLWRYLNTGDCKKAAEQVKQGADLTSIMAAGCKSVLDRVLRIPNIDPDFIRVLVIHKLGQPSQENIEFINAKIAGAKDHTTKTRWKMIKSELLAPQLFAAVKEASIAEVTRLLEDDGVSANVEDADGHTPLYHAMQSEINYDLVDVLLAHDAKITEDHTNLVRAAIDEEKKSAASALHKEGSLLSRFFSWLFDDEEPAPVPEPILPAIDKLQKLQQRESDLYVRQLSQALMEDAPDVEHIRTLIFSNKANPLHDKVDQRAVLKRLTDNPPVVDVLTAGILCNVLEVSHDGEWKSVDEMYSACNRSLTARLKKGDGFDITKTIIGDRSMLQLVRKAAEGVAADERETGEFKQLRVLLEEATNTALKKAVEVLDVEKVDAALKVGAVWRKEAEVPAGGAGAGGAAAEPIEKVNYLRMAIEKKNALAEEVEKLGLEIAKRKTDIARADEEIQKKTTAAEASVRGAAAALLEAQRQLSDELKTVPEAPEETSIFSGWLNEWRIWWEKRKIERKHSKAIQKADKTLDVMLQQQTDGRVEIRGIQYMRDQTQQYLGSQQTEHKKKTAQHKCAQRIVVLLQQAGANDMLVHAKTLASVREALELGADANAVVDTDGKSARFYALQNMPQQDAPEFNEHVERIKLLIQYGADFHDGADPRALPEQIRVPIYTGRLWFALQKGNVELATEMLQRGADVTFTHIDAEENTALNYAIHAPAHQRELVELLIKDGANPLQQTEKGSAKVQAENKKDGKSLPLDKSVRLINFAKSKKEGAQGEDTELWDDISSLLHVGSLFYMLRTLHDADEDLRQRNLTNILGVAMENTHHITLRNSDDLSPLRLAKQLKEQHPEVNYDEVIKRLQEKTNAALTEAVLNKNERAIEAAVKAGAQIDAKLIRALVQKENAMEYVQYIEHALDAGVSVLGGDQSPLQLVLKIQSRQPQSTALKQLRRILQPATNEKLFQATTVEDARAALEAGADICAVDDAHDRSALQFALQGGGGGGAGGEGDRAELLEFLQEKTQEALQTAVEQNDAGRIDEAKAAGANLNCALFWAIQQDGLAVFKALVEKGADPNAKYGKRNKTIFIDAARYGRLEIVKYLIEQNVDVLTPDKNGNTALHHVVTELTKSPANIKLMDIARAIIDANPAALEVKNGKGKRPQDIYDPIQYYYKGPRTKTLTLWSRRPGATLFGGSGSGAAAAGAADTAGTRGGRDIPASDDDTGAGVGHGPRPRPGP